MKTAIHKAIRSASRGKQRGVQLHVQACAAVEPVGHRAVRQPANGLHPVFAEPLRAAHGVGFVHQQVFITGQAQVGTPWCVYCRRIAPALDKIAEQYSGSLTVGQVIIDDEPQLAQKENIEVVPALLLYRNGQKLGSITAPASKAAIEAFLKEHLNG